jgi:uncharacterized protein involved in exopolysaccharide biosynthesis
MQNNEGTNTQPSHYPEIDEEINLLDYWRVIQKRWRLIVAMVIVAVLATGVISLVMTTIYRATAVITPVDRQDNKGGRFSLVAQQLGGLPGIAMSGTTSASEIVSLLKTKVLRKEVIERYHLLPELFFNEWDAKRDAWKKKDKDAIPTLWDGIRMLNGMVSVHHATMENMITLSVEYHNPEKAANIVNYFLTTLNEHMSSESKRVAETNKRYLEEQLKGSTDPLLKQRIYNLIAQQIETAMVAGVKENFAFKVIDPPMVPDTRIRPKRKQMVLISLVLSLFSGIFIAFVLEYVEKTRAAGGER